MRSLADRMKSGITAPEKNKFDAAEGAMAAGNLLLTPVAQLLPVATQEEVVPATSPRYQPKTAVGARAVIRENFSFPHHPATASSLRSCASVLRAGASCSTAANCCGQAWQRSASSQTLRSRLSVIRCPRSRQDAPRSRNQLAEKPLGLINPGDRESITFFIVTDYFQRLVFHIFIFL